MSAPAPSVLRLAAPLVVSFWMRAAFTMVDTVYAAMLGDAAVAAVGLTVPFEFLMIALWVGLSTGLTSGLGRAFGARDGAAADRLIAAAWRLVLGAAALFTAVGIGIWFVAPRLALAPEVARSFQLYGSAIVAGGALTMFWSVIPDSVVKAHHDMRSTMWAGIASNVLNLTFNTLFVFGFGWGIFGIGLGTVLGKLGGLAYAIGRARAHEARRRAAAPAEAPIGEGPRRPYRAILALAVPSSAAFALMATEGFVVNTVLASLERATASIAAYSIYHRVSFFAMQPLFAVGVAMLPFAARLFGEKNVAAVRRAVWSACGAVAAYVAIVAPVAVAVAPWVAARLADADSTRAFATFALRLVPLAVASMAPFIICRPVFEALGRGAPGLAIAALRYAVLAPPAAWLGMRLALGAGRQAIEGVIPALIACALVASGIFAVWTARTLRARP